MKRADIRKMFRDMRPRIVHWEVYKNPLIRRMLKISEDSRIRYEKAKRSIYHDKSLNDNQRTEAIGKALDRFLKDSKAFDALQRQYDLAWERREFRRLKAKRS